MASQSMPSTNGEWREFYEQERRNYELLLAEARAERDAIREELAAIKGPAAPVAEGDADADAPKGKRK